MYNSGHLNPVDIFYFVSECVLRRREELGGGGVIFFAVEIQYTGMESTILSHFKMSFHSLRGVYH